MSPELAMSAPTPVTYGDYLRLPELLAPQHPRSTPPAHDELLFITVHQAYELWFRQMLTELTDARDRLIAGESHLPRLRLRRCHVIERLLLEQFDILDTMAPQDFLQFRRALGSSSGAQSAQFHEIELLSGSKDRRGLRLCRSGTEAERRRLRRRLSEPTLWDGFLTVVANSGFTSTTKEDRMAAYLEIARNREDHTALWELAEALIEHDQAWSALWSRHALTVQRQIGMKPGTAGSTGGAYLTSRLDRRFYPELWELRFLL
jgi:tryptophan 2,3-dioxygenase